MPHPTLLRPPIWLPGSATKPPSSPRTHRRIFTMSGSGAESNALSAWMRGGARRTATAPARAPARNSPRLRHQHQQHHQPQPCGHT
eukprot:5309875-Pyramimonas_sp.AAC.1